MSEVIWKDYPLANQYSVSDSGMVYSKTTYQPIQSFINKNGIMTVKNIEIEAAKSIDWKSNTLGKAIKAGEIIQGHKWEQLENSEYARIKKLIDERNTIQVTT